MFMLYVICVMMVIVVNANYGAKLPMEFQIC
jgi:hypothetical protein